MPSEKISNGERSVAVKISKRGKQSQKAKETLYRNSTTENREPTSLDSDPPGSRPEEVQDYNCNTLNPIGQLVATHSAMSQQNLPNAEKNLPKPVHVLQPYYKEVMLLEKRAKEMLLRVRQENGFQDADTILPSPDHALRGFQTHQMMLEQQSKERLRRAHPEHERRNADTIPHHVLQDYPVQLVLLEQQNQKRLLRARQEQGSHAEVSIQEHEISTVQDSSHLDAGSEALPISLNSDSSKRKATGDETSSACSRAHNEGMKRRRYEEGYQFEHGPDSNERAVENMGHLDESQTLEAVGPSGVTGRTKEGALDPLSSTSTTQSPGVPSNDNSNTQESTDHSIKIEQLLKRVFELEEENSRLKKIQKDNENRPRVQVFHVLDDESKTICLKEPTWTFDSKGRLQLKAESRLIDYEQYLLHNPHIVCMVHKSYSTPRISRNQVADALVTGTMLPPTPIYESMQLRSYSRDGERRRENPEIGGGNR